VSKQVSYREGVDMCMIHRYFSSANSFVDVAATANISETTVSDEMTSFAVF
jgi:hypothetical protein